MKHFVVLFFNLLARLRYGADDARAEAFVRRWLGSWAS